MQNSCRVAGFSNISRWAVLKFVVVSLLFFVRINDDDDDEDHVRNVVTDIIEMGCF